MVADNIDGETPGDGTILLEEMIKNKMSGAAVYECIKTGIGDDINIKVGGRSEDYYGKPVEVNVYIKLR